MPRTKAAIFGWCLHGATLSEHKACPGTIEGGYWDKVKWVKTELITCACKKCKHKRPVETTETKGDLL